MWGLKNLTNVSTVRLEKKHPRKSLQSCLYVPVNKWKLLWAEKSRSWTARAPLWCWKCPHGPVVKTNGSVGCGLLRYSLLVWRSCLCEQRKNKEHEDDKHSKSDPEADDDGVWNAREESHQSSLLWKLKPISHASPSVPVLLFSPRGPPLIAKSHLLSYGAFSISKMWLQQPVCLYVCWWSYFVSLWGSFITIAVSDKAPPDRSCRKCCCVSLF